MADELRVDVVTPLKAVVQDRLVDEVAVPGTEGEFGVLPGHTPFLSTLKAGIVRLRYAGQDRYIAISDGFAEVNPHRVVILARTAEAKEQIDLERAQQALGRAEERLKGGGENTDIERARAALMRATVRIQAARM